MCAACRLVLVWMIMLGIVDLTYMAFWSPISATFCVQYYEGVSSYNIVDLCFGARSDGPLSGSNCVPT